MLTEKGDKFTVSGPRLTIKRDGQYEVFNLTPWELTYLGNALLGQASVLRRAAQVANIERNNEVSPSGDKSDD